MVPHAPVNTPYQMERTEQEQVAQLMEITQKGDAQECRAILEAAAWNMDAAVALSFDIGDRSVPSAASVPDPRPRARQELPSMSLLEELNQDLVSDAAPTVGPQPRVIESSIPFLSAILSPFKYALELIAAVFSNYQLLNRNAHYTGLDNPDPKRNSAQFAQQLEEEIGPEHIEFFEGSYSQALSEAKTNLRYLLVVVLVWKHQDTPAVLPWLKDADLVRITKHQKMVVWAGSLDNSEPYQVALGFKATQYPFIALIGPSPKTPQSNTVVMDVLLKGAILDHTSPADLAHTLDEKAIAHEPKVLALRLDRERNEADRSIRDQQDAAYQESLARDRARAQEAASQQQAAEDARQAKSQYAATLVAWKAAKLEQLAKLTGKTTRVQIRTPTGRRVVARFGESNTLRDLYDYVLSHEESDSEGIDTASVPAGDIQEFKPCYGFKLLVPVEKTVLAPTDDLLQHEPKVWPNGTLIVEPE